MTKYLLSTRRRDVTCVLNEHSLVWGDAPYRQVGYSEIRYIRIYGSPGWRYAGQDVVPTSEACDIAPRHGSRLSLVSRRTGYDRTDNHRAFTSELLTRVAIYPNVGIYTGMSWPVWLLWAFVFAVMAIGFAFSLLSLIFITFLPPSGDRSTQIIGGISFLTFFLFTGFGALGTWRLLRRERPRRRSAALHPVALPSI
jgi:hypothetical protein